GSSGSFRGRCQMCLSRLHFFLLPLYHCVDSLFAISKSTRKGPAHLQMRHQRCFKAAFATSMDSAQKSQHELRDRDRIKMLREQGIWYSSELPWACPERETVANLVLLFLREQKKQSKSFTHPSRWKEKGSEVNLPERWHPKVGIKRHPPLFKKPNRRKYKCKIQFGYRGQTTTNKARY
ncbi:unnamed protein product, partial [Bubo scandiacus]